MHFSISFYHCFVLYIMNLCMYQCKQWLTMFFTRILIFLIFFFRFQLFQSGVVLMKLLEASWMHTWSLMQLKCNTRVFVVFFHSLIGGSKVQEKVQGINELGDTNELITKFSRFILEAWAPLFIQAQLFCRTWTWGAHKEAQSTQTHGLLSFSSDLGLFKSMELHGFLIFTLYRPKKTSNETLASIVVFGAHPLSYVLFVLFW